MMDNYSLLGSETGHFTQGFSVITGSFTVQYIGTFLLKKQDY
jgi:hypothetical protein